MIDLFARNLLGAGVAGRADKKSGFGHFGIATLSDTKIHHLCDTCICDQDIVGFNVAVNDTVFMGVIQCFGDLVEHILNLAVIGELTFFYFFVEGLAFEIFHRDKGAVALLAQIVKDYDIGMMQFAANLGFIIKAFEKLFAF